MPGEKESWRHRIEFRGLQLLLLLVRVLPETILHRVLRGLVFFFAGLSGRYHKILRNNLSLAFPEMNAARRRHLARRIYRHFSLLLADNLLKLSGREPRLKRPLNISGLNHLEAALSRGRGVILYSAHFGNWEMIPSILAEKTGRRITNIARPMDNPLVEKLVSSFRNHPGTAIVYKKNALRVILECLKNNEMVGVLIDQNTVPREALFVDFFGRPATVNPVMAQLSLKKNIPLLSAFLHYEDAGAVSLEIGTETNLNAFSGTEGLQNLLQEMTSRIEEKIRRHPEQWLWFHNRWKTKPQGDKNALRQPGRA